MIKEKSKLHRIDLYNCDFEFIVTDNIVESVCKRKKFQIDKDRIPDGASGLSVSKSGHFGILVGDDELTHSFISHEIFHTCLHIMERIEHPIEAGRHEPHAYLCGYLAELIYGDISKWKLEVT